MADPINSKAARTEADVERQLAEQLPTKAQEAFDRGPVTLEDGTETFLLDPIVINVETDPNAQEFGFGSSAVGGEAFGTNLEGFSLAGEANFEGVSTVGGDTTIGPDFTPVTFDSIGGANAISPADDIGVNFGQARGNQVPGERAITDPAPQPDFTGVGNEVGGEGAITGINETIGPNFSNPTGTGPEDPGGNGNSPTEMQANVGGNIRQTVTRPNSPDWRFRIGLLPGSEVLYKDGDSSSLLSPLLKTDGVIFPYTPNVLVNYRANYDKVSPTHSNFPTYFYQSSEVSDVQINATFTAQSVEEADYMMAMIHFFRSSTKMFYGQDANKGQPPPLVSVTGFGQHQFNFHKAVVSQFNYSLPDEVDYIRTSAGGNGSLQAQATRAQLSGGSGDFGMFGIATRIGRLLGIGAEAGAEGPGGGFAAANEGTDLSRADASYVPTKIEVSLILLPVVTRAEQSNRYSTKDYANGKGLSQRGHW